MRIQLCSRHERHHTVAGAAFSPQRKACRALCRDLWRKSKRQLSAACHRQRSAKQPKKSFRQRATYLNAAP
jgi:hypothetical protein